MSQTESETRKSLIDKRLADAGWNVSDPSQVVTELAVLRTGVSGVNERIESYDARGYSDYALIGDDGSILAVIEAKKSSLDARVGREQAKQYAEDIQKSTGKDLPFILYTNGNKIYFWDSEKYPPREVYGFPTKNDLNRLRFLSKNEKPLSQELINRDISGRPYQIEAIRSVFEALEAGKRKFLLVMATGTGKTRTCVSMIDVLMRANRVQRVLFLVDRIALQQQALEAFKEYLPNAPEYPRRGDTQFITSRRIYVMTYKTMLNIIESPDNGIRLSPHFFDMIVADESHRSIYNTYRSIFSYFDTIQLGLTATPKDAVERNTFKLFECEDGLPTYAYSYEEAVNNDPPYLCDYEVLSLVTTYQKQGIKKSTIPLEEQKKLLREGKDPETLDYEGSELEKTVSNRGTNALIIQEFMEECIKDDTGTLPGKTIFFAISIHHARRLEEIFDRLYPEHKGRLARVIVSEDERVHDKGGLLDQFKNQNMPRIAISVDMLDTGIDVREIVNLVFAKPVYSYTKFWQMIGRGTRLLEPRKAKPWCTKKDKFLIIDCWSNFEFFQMNPAGKEEKPQKALPVRLFEARIVKLLTAFDNKNHEAAARVTDQLKSDISRLPENNVTIMDASEKLAKLDENFWQRLNRDKANYLLANIAPLMRTRTNEDFKGMVFELRMVLLSAEKINLKSPRPEKLETLADGCREMVSELPLSVNIVRVEADLINSIVRSNYLLSCTDEECNNVVRQLAPLMKYRNPVSENEQEILDIRDETFQKGYIKYGPANERVTVMKYREKVEELIRTLADENEILQKIREGEEITGQEINTLADYLGGMDPYPTLENLQKIYDARRTGFLDLIQHILGLKSIKTFSEKVNDAFDQFIGEHNTLNPRQLQFLNTLRMFIIETGDLSRKDLVNEPFTKIHNRGILGLFDPAMQQKILQVTNSVLGHA